MKTIQISMKPNIFVQTKDEAGEGPGGGHRGPVRGRGRGGPEEVGGVSGGRGGQGRGGPGGRPGGPGGARGGGGGGGGRINRYPLKETSSGVPLVKKGTT